MKPKILVIGDSFLDEYLYCTYRKSNPESDGSVYSIERKEYFLGGAAAVAMMCRSLDADVTLATLLSGLWPTGKKIKDLLYEYNIKLALQQCSHYNDSRKTRYISNNEIFPDRFDEENIQTLNNWAMICTILDKAKDSDIILISDYGKGVITEHLLNNLPINKIILVDPAINRSWGDYRKATIIKANEKEAIAALNEAKTISHISDYARTLLDIYDRSVVVTRGEIGIQFAYHNQTTTTKQHTGGFVKAVQVEKKKDVCGAGDTVFAVLGVYLARGYSLQAACEFAVRYTAQQIQSFGIHPLHEISIPELERTLSYATRT